LDWFGALSAIGFNQPYLTDLELKEKLLKVFTKENHALPEIETLPVLVPVLNRLQVPHVSAFLDDTVLVRALSHQQVPLIYFNRTWVPIVSYDAFREGFYYYDYTSNQNRLLRFNSNETLFSKKDSTQTSAIEVKNKIKYKKFISRQRIKDHLLNIGGIGLLIGDTTHTPPNQAKAAFLIELGDRYYQTQNNFTLAAQAYRTAQIYYDNWVVKERMGFLVKHYYNRQFAKGKIASLFAPDKYTELLNRMEWTPQNLDTVQQRVFAGKAGTAILQQWPTPNLYYQPELLDTLFRVYTVLHKKEPHNSEYLDSLASLEYKRKNYASSREYYQILNNGSPFGDQVAILNLAWTLLLENKNEQIAQWLPRASQIYYPAKYYTLAAAVDLHNKNLSKAFHKLKRSLKEDKTLYPTHDLFAQY